MIHWPTGLRGMQLVILAGLLAAACAQPPPTNRSSANGPEPGQPSARKVPISRDLDPMLAYIAFIAEKAAPMLITPASTAPKIWIGAAALTTITEVRFWSLSRMAMASAWRPQALAARSARIQASGEFHAA